MGGIKKRQNILLLGNCGLERLADRLREEVREGVEVVVGGWTQVELVERVGAGLVYVDLFGWDVVGPVVVGVVGRREVRVELGPLRGVVGVLEGEEARGVGVVYRGLRRPSAGAFGVLGGEDNAKLIDLLEKLEGVVRGKRVLDVGGLWQRAGQRLDDVMYGMGHGEALDLVEGPGLEARWLGALWRARTRGAVKCVVVDLDGTLIHGEVAADDFHEKNPAYLPHGAQPTRPLLEGWWRLKRGLHEALKIVANRGIVLALATRNDPAVVAERWRKRPAVPDGDPGLYHRMYEDLTGELREAAFGAHPWMLDVIAVGPSDMAHMEAGFGAKSEMCARIAAHLGIGLGSLAFLDDSEFEREEVRQNAPEVLVLDGEVSDFREQLLFAPAFTVWEVTEEARLRGGSYRSRAEVVSMEQRLGVERAAAGGVALQNFLLGLGLCVGVRPAGVADVLRVQELLLRTHQLDLTGARPEITADVLDGVYVGWCRDRIADHGVVAVGVFRHQRLEAWVCSCRVLPHRVAPTLLWAMLCYHPEAQVERVPTALNGVTRGLIEEARGGPASWVRIMHQETL